MKPIKLVLNGKTLNLGDDMSIKSNNFNVDSKGNMTCSSANITGGKLLLDGGTENNPLFQMSRGQEYTKIVGSHMWMSGGNQRDVIVTLHRNPSNRTSGISLNSSDNGAVLEVGNGTVSNFFSADGKNGNVTVLGPINANSFNNNSKEELKKNISKYDKKVLETINNSDIYEFNYKIENDNERRHLGFIIGQKYNTPNEIISQNGTSIDTYSMCSFMWKAIQELSKKVEELENKLKEKEENNG